MKLAISSRYDPAWPDLTEGSGHGWLINESVRMNKVRLAFLALVPILITACGTTRGPAPVVERTPPPRSAEPRPAQPVAAQPGPKQADGRGFYTVKKGDTLIQIALEFGQNYRDLVAWNNLSNPHDIKIDQVLRVTPPDGTSTGVQTASVSPGAAVEARPLPAPSGMVNKSTPRGEKRPYSEGALADMNKQELASLPPGGVRSEPPKITDTRPSDKAGEQTGVDDDGLSWVWPAQGKIIGAFNESRKGIDIGGQLGQPIYAAGAGKVLYAGSGIRGYGNLVIVKHNNNLLSAYAHNKTILVKEDQIVSKGQKIAEMGNSDTDSVKLHFEIRQQGKPVDPSKFLPNPK